MGIDMNVNMEMVFNFIKEPPVFDWFSVVGLILVALTMIPNILFAIQPQRDRPSNIKNDAVPLIILESLSRVVFIVLLVLLDYTMSQNIILLGIIIVSLMIYYFLWYGYFKEGCRYPDLFTKKFLFVPMPMAVFPIIYFLLVSIWLQNLPALITVAIFGICHLWNSNVIRKQLLGCAS